MGWLIDTGLWIAVERGTLGAADIHAITKQAPVYLSPVSIAEIRFGVDLMPPGPKKQRAMALLRRLRRKPQLRLTVETAETFGMLAARLRKAGRDPEVRINDLWLAAVCAPSASGAIDVGYPVCSPAGFASGSTSLLQA